MTMAQEHRSSTGKYVVVYVCILVIAALQFVVAYSAISGPQMFTRMLILAIVEAALAVLFFMHLWVESRGLLWFVVIFTVFVLLAMQYGWTDSFRLVGGAPWAK
jgi:caa(3)-type oxidase subunit IV